MSAAGFQRALAHVLVSDAARTQLHEQPHLLAERYDVAPDELRALAGIDPARLDFTAAGLRRARLRTLRRMFATTLTRWGDPEQAQAVLTSFVATNLPRTGPDETSRWLDEGARFVDYLANPELTAIPSLVGPLARLEWLRFHLLYDPDANRAAAEADGTDPWTDQPGSDMSELRLEVGRNVRLAQFPPGVLSMPTPPKGTPAGHSRTPLAPTHVALRLLHTGKVRVYRLAELVHAVVSRCDGATRFSDIAAALAAPAGSRLGADVTDAARFAMIERLVLPRPTQGTGDKDRGRAIQIAGAGLRPGPPRTAARRSATPA